MNEILNYNLFYFIVVFFISKKSLKMAVFFSILPLVLFLTPYKQPIANLYAFLSSIIIVITTKKFEIKNNRSIDALIEKQKNLEKNLSELKQETDKSILREKKNQYLHSIFTILSQAFEIEAIKSIEKYADEYAGEKTSLYIKVNDRFEKIYGDTENIPEKLKSIIVKNGKTIIPIGEKETYFAFIINSPDNKSQNFIEFTSEITPFLKRIYLFSKIEELSLKDGLSGLYRRQIFNEKLEEEIIRAKNFKHLLGLMMIDIDHFKNINDTYGHQAGDEVIKGVSAILKNCVYETDFVARYGGEEFAIIMPRAEREGSARKANYIRESVENHKFKFGIIDLKVTISIGIAYYPVDAISKEDLIQKADKALYYSKQNGRNRVTNFSQI
ncbi:MAG: GGDEF domain-containing protein [Elusimicrobiota bacterium]